MLGGACVFFLWTVWTTKHIIHPGRLTWNLQMTHLERKLIFQTSMLMFNVNLQGCNLEYSTVKLPFQIDYCKSTCFFWSRCFCWWWKKSGENSPVEGGWQLKSHYLILFAKVLYTSHVVGNGISELSTVWNTEWTLVCQERRLMLSAVSWHFEFALPWILRCRSLWLEYWPQMASRFWVDV